MLHSLLQHENVFHDMSKIFLKHQKHSPLLKFKIWETTETHEILQILYITSRSHSKVLYSEQQDICLRWIKHRVQVINWSTFNWTYQILWWFSQKKFGQNLGDSTQIKVKLLVMIKATCRLYFKSVHQPRHTQMWLLYSRKLSILLILLLRFLKTN